MPDVTCIRPHTLCPHCGAVAGLHSRRVRRIREVGGRVITYHYGVYICRACWRISCRPTALAPRHGRWSWRVIRMVRALRRQGLRGYGLQADIRRRTGWDMSLQTIHDITNYLCSY